MESNQKFVGYRKGKTLNKQEVAKINEKKPVISFWMYVYCWFRSYLLQSSYNYSNYQGNGYSYMLFPALKRIYANNTKALQESLTKNSLFYNTNPQLVPLVTSIHITMLLGGKTEDEAIAMKMALMGPLAGIGDSISQFCLAPIFASIGSYMALEGSVAGPIFFIIGVNVVLIAIKMFTGYVGWKVGTSYINTLSTQMKTVLNAAMIVGITIICALAISFTKVNIHIITYGTGPDGEQKEMFNLATMFNNMIPYFFTIILLVSVYLLIKKAQWTTYKIILTLLVIGLVGGATGILV